MKILYYNWVDYLDDENRGGGVSVYQRNLLRALDGQDDLQAAFLSSGISYDLAGGRPRWAPVRHGPARDRDRRFEIVNSGALSPAHHSFGSPAQIEHPATEAAFFDFIEATGPYDVVHFNNLEGLPARVLELKRRWPQTRVILSLHNYYPFCPQVNLWHREREACRDFDAGRKCADCLPHRPDPRLIRLANALAFRLKRAGIRPGTRAFDALFRPTLRVGGRLARLPGRLRRLLRGAPAAAAPGPGPARERAAAFAARRAEMVRLINAHCDRVLCVSDRVGQIARHYGIAPELVQTSYIGTEEARKFGQTAPRPALLGADGTLRLGYLGYMRRDKGFFFLLDALEALPEDIAARLRLVAAARRGDAATMARLERLRPRLAELTHVDGYSHDDLDRLLARVDVGLVPVLWEDNLPQVAIEMHARHIPLLTSDMGGAQELGHCPEMVFPAGSAAGFAERVAAILEGRVTARDYWRNAVAPVEMPAHLRELRAVYGAPASAR
ncbi:glycosyltransferase [Actibacterium sp. MT2.3-13A]|uniref:glycosyltransferase n=1 Tax=Actibacterium sp. MT2.3-13A TaxID=2828332 RepID=UPI001BAC30BE|nr:glycosyltransferase [Actibacterium sp. MT2.3-13A]